MSSYEIQGRTVTLPVSVRDASSGTVMYAVDRDAAQKIIPPEFEADEMAPGKTQLCIVIVDYRDNDLGDYNEVSIAFFVRKRGAPRGVPYLGTLVDMMRGTLPTHIIHLPVTQSFTCEAGQTIWGFPKTVDEIDFDTAGSRARCTWNKDGQNVLRISMPLGGKRDFPERTLSTYSYIDGVLHRTQFASSAGVLGVRLGGAEIELGSHPIADELRSLGLPKPALMSMWLDRMTGSFERARPVG